MNPSHPKHWEEAMSFLSKGDFKSAISEFEKLVKDQSPESIRYHHWALGNMGVAYARLGQFDKSIISWDRAADASLNLGLQYEAIEVLNRALQIAMSSGGDVGSIYDKMNKIWGLIEHPSKRRSAGSIMAKTMLEMGDVELAERTAIEALTIATGSQWPDKKDEMAIRRSLVSIHLRKAKYQDAVQQCEVALSCAKYLGDLEAEGGIKGSLGIAYRYLDRYEKAVEQYLAAIDIFERFKDYNAIGTNLMNLASSYFLLKRVKDGRETALEALSIFDSLNATGLANRVLLMLSYELSMDQLNPSIRARIKDLES
ncbi:MAG: tetratricopeptide repeat protein [Candidatus Thorarchaeota archaeon]